MDFCGFIKKYGDGEGGVYWVLIMFIDCVEYNFFYC